MVKHSNSKRRIVRVNQWKDCDIDKTKQIPTHGITEPQFGRLGYDSCAYKKDVQESVSPGLYNLNGRTHYDSCFMNHSGYLESNENRGVLASNIDKESELRSLNYKNSRCPEARYNPMKNCKNCEKCNAGIPCGCNHCKKDPHSYKKKDCKSQIIPEYTRESKACNDITSMNINRFEPLCIDVQKKSRIQSNAYIGQQTRNNMKDLTRYMRNQLPEPEFEKYCDCGKVIGIHTTLSCLYEKDKKNHKVLPNNWTF